jgi:uncharacterized phage infection (PIP) family protein YhgE
MAEALAGDRSVRRRAEEPAGAEAREATARPAGRRRSVVGRPGGDRSGAGDPAGPEIERGAARPAAPSGSRPPRLGIALSVLWLALCAAAIALIPADPAGLLRSLPDLSALVAGAVAPLVLLWVILGRAHRAERLQAATEPLRRDITRLTDPDAGAEERWRGVLGAVRHEMDELAASAERIVGRLSLVQREVRREVEHVQSAGEDARAGLQRFQDSFRQSAEQFTPIVFQVAESVDGLEQRLSAGIRQLSDGAESTRERLGWTLEILQGESNALAGAMQDLENRVAAVGESVSGQGDQFSERVRTAFAGLENAGDTIRDSVQRLEAAAEAGGTQQARIVTALGDRTAALELAGQTLVERLGSVHGSLKEAVAAAARTEDGAADEARTMAATLRNEIAALNEAGNRFSTMQAQLNDQARLIADASTRANAPLQTLQANVESLRATGESLSHLTAGLDARLDEAVARMARGSDEMAATLDRADGTADGLERAVRDGTTRLSGLAEDLSERTARLTGLIGEREEGLREALSASDARAQALAAVWREEAEQLQGIQANSERATARVRTLADELQDRLNGLVDTADGLGGRFTGLPDAIAAAARQLEERAGTAAAGMEASGERLRASSGEILAAIDEASGSGARWAGAAQELLGQLQAARTDLDAGGREMAAMVERSRSETERLQAAVAQGTDALGATAGDLAGKVDHVTTAYDQRVAALLRAMTLATARANEINAAFRREAADVGEVNRLAEDAAARLAGLQEGLRRQTESLSSEAEGLNARLAGLPAVVDETMTALQQRTDATLARARLSSEGLAGALGQMLERVEGAMARGDRLTADIEAGSGRLTEASETAVDRLGVLASQFQQQLAAFQDTVRETVAAINHAGESIGGRMAQLDDGVARMDAGVARLDQGVARVDESVGRVDAGIDRVDGKAESTRESVTAITEDIGRWMESTSERLTAAGARLRDEMTAMAATARDVRAELERTPRMPAAPAAAAAADAPEMPADAAAAPRDEAPAAPPPRRQAFIASARPVLEGLHVLSVDIDRLLDEDIPESAWRAFHRGDLSAFTRRLAARRDSLPLADIAGRYGEDEAFRGHVDRYIGQFERVIADALRHESGDLMSTGLITSDIGKVYMLLCTALDRQPLAGSG